MVSGYATAMKMFAVLLLGLAAAAPMPAPPMLAPTVSGAAQRHDDQMSAAAQRRAGRILPLPEIERRVVPQMRGSQYIGMEFDGSTSIYTLKFLRGGSVIWVDVDGRTGQVIGRTGK